MNGINDLSAALRAGSQAKAQMSGLDEQYERANALRGAAGPKINQYGTVSPLSVLAGVVGKSQGRKQLRDLAPQRAAARQSMADNENAQGLYNAKIAANKVVQDQSNYDDTAAATVDAARTLNANKGLTASKLAETNANAATTAYGRDVATEATRVGTTADTAELLASAKVEASKVLTQGQIDAAIALAGVNASAADKAEVIRKAVAAKLAEAKANTQGKPEAWVNKDGSGQVTGFMTPSGFVDKHGKPLDIGTKIPYKEFSVATNEVGSGVGKQSAKSILGFKNTIRAVDDTYAAIGNMTEDDRAAFDDKGSQLKNILIKSLAPASFEAIAEDSLAGYPPATKKMLVILNKMSGEERNRLFGGALTATELSSSRDFLPAVMGRGLEWVVNTLETGKRSSANSLHDIPSQRGWLVNNGIVGEDYAPTGNALGFNPLAQTAEKPVDSGGAWSPEDEARLNELQARGAPQ
jgi:hypothetical protein